MSSELCLLIDNSNTRTKFMLCGGGAQPELRVLPTAQISKESLHGLLSDWSFRRVVLCSVVPWAAEEISSFMKGVELIQVHPANVTEVDFSGYPGCATLGADRVANVLAAVHYAPLPLVAVDMGTATTLDVVVQGAAGPKFAGGIIAPGLSAVAGCLPRCTAQLPSVNLNIEGPVIGRNTEEAMASAVCVGYPGMMDSLLDAIESELGERVHVIVTGGDAARLAPAMWHKCTLVPSLTLEGIARVAHISL